MTVSLTFDDGISAHAAIAAPLLEKYGWRGAFNVITDFLSPSPATLTPEKLRILSLEQHPDKRMSWADASRLLAAGHEVNPHSCTHEKLGDLAKQGQTSVLVHEVLDAARDYQMHLGVWPKFFCCPHLDWTPAVRTLIRSNRMEMFNNNRPGFGTGARPLDVVHLLCERYFEGRRHVDLVFHGIVAREGGFSPFEDEATFGALLQALKTLEASGLIRVVPYAQVHHGYSRLMVWYDFWQWFRNKMRRIFFRLIYHDRHDVTSWDEVVTARTEG